MKFDPEKLTGQQNYKLMTGAVIPRPIGWISTVSKDGINNVAPFSFFNAMAGDPPHVAFSSGWPGGEPKDTLKNILDSGEFVANLVHEATAEQMNITATVVRAEVDEFEMAGLTAVASEKIAAPRVKESLVNFECKMVHSYNVEGRNGEVSGTIVIGKVVMMHIDKSILDDNFRIDPAAFKPIGRLAGGMYAKVNDLFEIKRPPPQK